MVGIESPRSSVEFSPNSKDHGLGSIRYSVVIGVVFYCMFDPGLCCHTREVGVDVPLVYQGVVVKRCESDSV